MSKSYERKVLKNTAILYLRVICLAILSLYTIRVVLQTLGVEDFGIYSAVAGVTAMSVFLPGTLASATQRFFSFSLGQGNDLKSKEVFSVSILLYIAIACVAIILLEGAGLFFVANILDVPVEKEQSVILLYHFSVATFVMSIFTAPFIALIIAHEEMKFYAYVSIIDAVIKLILVFCLDYFPFNSLIGYGVVLFLASCMTATLYLYTCLKQFEECQFKTWHWNSSLAKEIVGFTGWTCFGQLSTVARNQSVTVLLNQYFIPSIVAARSIAVTTGSQINVFATGFNTSLYSPIVRAYAANDRESMYDLVFMGSRLTFFLMWIFALPIYMHMELVLQIWLGLVPDEAALFTKFVLIESVILAASLPLATAARAHGRMGLYEGVMGSLQISILVISWLLLRNGWGAVSVFFVAVCVSSVMYFVRILIVASLTKMLILEYVKRVIFPLFKAIVVTTACVVSVSVYVEGGGLMDILSFAISFLVCVVYAYFIGIDAVLRQKINSVLISKFAKIRA